jgi:hypothetical protein
VLVAQRLEVTLGFRGVEPQPAIGEADDEARFRAVAGGEHRLEGVEKLGRHLPLIG